MLYAYAFDIGDTLDKYSPRKTRDAGASFSASYWPDVVVVRLVVVVDVAVVEVHVPRVRRAVGVGSTRPVVVGLYTFKSVHFSHTFEYATKYETPGTRSPLLKYDFLNKHAC